MQTLLIMVSWMFLIAHFFSIFRAAPLSAPRSLSLNYLERKLAAANVSVEAARRRAKQSK